MRTARRGACLFLSCLLLFLSYKPATALLFLAGAARNPTEDKSSGPHSGVDVRENLPRPAKKQLRETQERLVQKCQKSRTLSPDEKTLLELVLLSLPSARLGTISEPSAALKSDVATPDYLRPFLPATPGSPHSPPA